MCSDFASLCQKMFITLIILMKIMFQQVQAMCKAWHKCELAISHHTHNIRSNNNAREGALGKRIDLTLIWS